MTTLLLDPAANFRPSPGRISVLQPPAGPWVRDERDVFAGSEVFLLQNMRHGGVGCITATGNVNPGPIDHLYRTWQGADADHQQAEIAATRVVLQRLPMIPALKATIAHFLQDPAWRTVRPPLVELTSGQEADLVAGLAARGFDMPGIRG